MIPTDDVSIKERLSHDALAFIANTPPEVATTIDDLTNALVAPAFRELGEEVPGLRAAFRDIILRTLASGYAMGREAERQRG